MSQERLERWERHGLLTAERGRVRGNTAERAYSRAQVLGVIALRELERAGVSQNTVRAAASGSRDQLRWGIIYMATFFR